MSGKPYWLLFLHFIFLIPHLQGQYYDGGHEPASVQWRVISTGRFDLVYPDTMERKAQQLAQYMDSVLTLMKGSYAVPLRKVPVVLHNQMSVSNAFVGWAPSRMEFYTIPPADGYPQDWLEQLSVHESTHWYQFSQMYQGATGVLARIFGEHIAAGVFGLHIPFWVIEGDAVHNETRFSPSGRGRDASFEQLNRTLLMTGSPYSYEKAYLGSFHDQTANHYELGYQLVAYGREQFGNHLWDSVYTYVARNPYHPMAFNAALKRYTGLGKKGFYTEGMNSLSRQWQVFDRFRPSSDSAETLMPADEWHYYRFPMVTAAGEVLAEQTSMDEIRTLVRAKDPVSPERLFYPGYNLGTGYTLSGDKIYFTSFTGHVRWPNIQYGDIRIFDLQTGTQKRLTKSGRYLSPAADALTGEIYSISYEPDHRHALVRMDASGKVISHLRLPDGVQASDLSFCSIMRRAILTLTDGAGRAIWTWDGGAFLQQVTPSTWVNIGHPVSDGSSVYYHASFDGVNDIYRYDLNASVNFRITRSRFGDMYPFIDRAGNLVCSQVRSDGMAVVRYTPEQFLNERVEMARYPVGFVYGDRLRNTGVLGAPMSQMCDSCFRSEKYSPARHLFRFHSWAPAAIDPDAATVKPGISVFSQNTLSTMFSSAGFRYDVSSLDREFFFSMDYRGFWPQITMDLNFTDVLYQSNDTSISNFRYGRQQAGLTLGLPLSATTGEWSRLFSLQLGVNYLGFTHYPGTYDGFYHGGMAYVQSRVYLHQLKRKAIRDLYPEWGQVLDFSMISTIAGRIDAGNTAAIRLITYLPGLLDHHGFRIYLAAQKRVAGTDLGFNRLIQVPRGFAGFMVDEAVAAQINYKFPLCYPDFSLGSLLYLKRVTMLSFFDFLSGEYQQKPLHIRSYGFEWNADVHLFTHFAPVNIGYGLAFPAGSKPFHYLLFNIDFSI
jgi:hypothetical protein